VLSTFFDVADRSYLPTIVPRRRLVAANSALTASSSVAEFTGFGISGFLITLFTAPIAIAIDAVSFLVSAILLATIRRSEPAPAPVADREPVLHEIRDGMRIVLRSPVLRALALAHGGTHILWGIFGTSYLLFATNELDLDPAAIGVIAGVGGIGSLAGSFATPILTRRIGIGRTIVFGMVVFAIGNALIPLAPPHVAVIGAALLMSQQLVGDWGATIYEIVGVSLTQASVGERVLGRVNATIGTFTTLLTLAGAIYVTLVCLLPEFLILRWNVPFYFGGTSLLIIVVVTMDFMAQVQAYVMTHQYESLLRKASFKGGLPAR